jgi:hypothetical protein
MCLPSPSATHLCMCTKEAKLPRTNTKPAGVIRLPDWRQQ